MHKIFCSVALGALVLSCSGKKESGDNKAQANAPKMEKVEYIYHDGSLHRHSARLFLRLI